VHDDGPLVIGGMPMPPRAAVRAAGLRTVGLLGTAFTMEQDL